MSRITSILIALGIVTSLGAATVFEDMKAYVESKNYPDGVEVQFFEDTGTIGIANARGVPAELIPIAIGALIYADTQLGSPEYRPIALMTMSSANGYYTTSISYVSRYDIRKAATSLDDRYEVIDNLIIQASEQNS